MGGGMEGAIDHPHQTLFCFGLRCKQPSTAVPNRFPTAGAGPAALQRPGGARARATFAAYSTLVAGRELD